MNQTDESKTRLSPKRILVFERRGTLDIFADLLSVIEEPCGKTQIMRLANLNYEQCQRYLASLERLGHVTKITSEQAHTKFVVTERGRRFRSDFVKNFGSIFNGERSVWEGRRSCLYGESKQDLLC